MQQLWSEECDANQSHISGTVWEKKIFFSDKGIMGENGELQAEELGRPQLSEFPVLNLYINKIFP